MLDVEFISWLRSRRHNEKYKNYIIVDYIIIAICTQNLLQKKRRKCPLSNNNANNIVGIVHWTHQQIFWSLWKWFCCLQLKTAVGVCVTSCYATWLGFQENVVSHVPVTRSLWSSWISRINEWFTQKLEGKRPQKMIKRLHFCRLIRPKLFLFVKLS